MIKEIGDVIDQVGIAIVQAEIETGTEIIVGRKDRVQDHTDGREVEVVIEAVDLQDLGDLDLVIGAGIGIGMAKEGVGTKGKLQIPRNCYRAIYSPNLAHSGHYKPFFYVLQGKWRFQKPARRRRRWNG